MPSETAIAPPENDWHLQPSPFRGSIKELDGMRGLAILLVLVCHLDHFHLIYTAGWGLQGWVGVDLFFVLSGFLITGILLDSRSDPHYFRNFYARRALRIWPVYFLTLAAVFLVIPFLMPEYAQSLHAEPFWPYLLLLQNLFVAGIGPAPLGTTWSLAVEEQFYLVWPLLVRNLKAKHVFILAATVVLVSPWLRYEAAWSDFIELNRYKHTLLRLDGLALGAILATWARHPCFDLHRLRKISIAALFVCTPLSLWLIPKYPSGDVSEIFTFTVVDAMFAGLVGFSLSGTGSDSWWPRLLRSRWLTGLGYISYGLYLVHLPVLEFITGNGVQRFIALQPLWMNRVITLALSLIAALGLAYLSRRWFEDPILRLKHRFDPMKTDTISSHADKE